MSPCFTSYLLGRPRCSCARGNERQVESGIGLRLLEYALNGNKMATTQNTPVHEFAMRLRGTSTAQIATPGLVSKNSVLLTNCDVVVSRSKLLQRGREPAVPKIFACMIWCRHVTENPAVPRRHHSKRTNLRGHVAQHCGTHGANIRSADSRCDMVISRSNVRGQRA